MSLPSLLTPIESVRWSRVARLTIAILAMKTALTVSFQFSSFAEDVLRSLLTTWVGSPYFNLGFVLGIATALQRDDCSFQVAEKSLWGVACALGIAAWTTIPDPYF